MILGDEHIKYLFYVKEGKIAYQGNAYKNTDWMNGNHGVDQLVAVRAERLGLTHLVHHKVTGHIVVALTNRGFQAIQDEEQAWNEK